MSNKTNNSKLYDCLTNNAQLRRYLSGRTRSSEEAADIYQESVARVLEQSRKSTINNPIGYAIRVARNLLTARPVDCDDDIDNLDSPKANPEYLLEEAQRIELISQALENMPEQRRRAFELRRLHGESRKAIAEQLGISMETVTRHITRALADIQRYIDSKTK
ncbi:RNA polymerase sigma factor [Idiomarina loihiensis]|uniref:RNA polymerase sigma factor n=1 Tax=Idiomarina loihiensis TaxID=135577 RepID=UPI001E4D3456|nr:sigma-70 family RNA polymerase sigma factor [Idiomarina loihiensis]